ncbi:hypothetical protein HETIRDRAFT_413880 [Heterobasidion irregulare TC 32-1]|uniref:Uncharacterized protein n=1 Tax=Heterobasidion irregulare (strain TC 32-1) TaxID=747525 RepID=W4KQ79_HETIT|nr:uncharacterized protein HETIRDRAFT_413880 [Heterobasidion irregulare TC 32-1]ETW87839.1 hypothetical protein HETIRDRAFT_413880 [Heterobasidion irregulare TC 32-1]
MVDFQTDSLDDLFCLTRISCDDLSIMFELDISFNISTFPFFDQSDDCFLGNYLVINSKIDCSRRML